jgi:uncharacterized protein (DUF433 family)
MNTQQVVHSDPEIMSGTPVFVGTRVPVYNLFDYLEAGDSLEKFLTPFPSVNASRQSRRWNWRRRLSLNLRALVDESLPVELADELPFENTSTVRAQD